MIVECSGRVPAVASGGRHACARARDPALSPDGGRLLFVMNKMGVTRLAMLDLTKEIGGPATEKDIAVLSAPTSEEERILFAAIKALHWAAFAWGAGRLIERPWAIPAIAARPRSVSRKKPPYAPST